MPKIAETDQGLVLPTDEGDKFCDTQTLVCPHCNEKMGHNPGSTRKDGVEISPYFYHTGELADDTSGAGCSEGGESAEHEEMKVEAIEAARSTGIPGHAEKEATFGDHQVDVVFIFDDEHPEYGKGFALEVQYKNKSKNYVSPTKTYLLENYSVVWVFDDDTERQHAQQVLEDTFGSGFELCHRDTDLSITSPITPRVQPVNSDFHDPVTVRRAHMNTFELFCPNCAESHGTYQLEEDSDVNTDHVSFHYVAPYGWWSFEMTCKSCGTEMGKNTAVAAPPDVEPTTDELKDVVISDWESTIDWISGAGKAYTMYADRFDWSWVPDDESYTVYNEGQLLVDDDTEYESEELGWVGPRKKSFVKSGKRGFVVRDSGTGDRARVSAFDEFEVNGEKMKIFEVLEAGVLDRA